MTLAVSMTICRAKQEQTNLPKQIGDTASSVLKRCTNAVSRILNRSKAPTSTILTSTLLSDVMVSGVVPCARGLLLIKLSQVNKRLRQRIANSPDCQARIEKDRQTDAFFKKIGIGKLSQ